MEHHIHFFSVLFTLCSVVFTLYSVVFKLCSVVFTLYSVIFGICDQLLQLYVWWIWHYVQRFCLNVWQFLHNVQIIWHHILWIQLSSCLVQASLCSSKSSLYSVDCLFYYVLCKFKFVTLWSGWEFVCLSPFRESQLVPSVIDGTRYEIICVFDKVWKHIVILSLSWNKLSQLTRISQGYNILCHPLKYMLFI